MQKVEISTKTIIFTVLLLLGLRFVWMIKDLILSLYIAFIIMSALKPPVIFLQKKRVPRFFAVVVVYLIFLGILLNLLLVIFPPLVQETAVMFRNLPGIVVRLSPTITQYVHVDSLTQYIPNLTVTILDFIRGVFSNLVFFISTLFFGFYLLLDEDPIKELLNQFLDERKRDVVVSVFRQTERRMAGWFWGEIILMTVVGIMTYIGLTLIQIRFVLPLAVMAGLLEIVPNLGPVLAAIPAIIIGLSASPFLGLVTLALYFLVQQLENQLIVPVVMRRAVGLHPIVILIALIVGGTVAGTLGILLAIPIALFLETILVEIRKRKATVAEKLR